MKRVFLAGAVIALLLEGCADLGYYLQSVSGQIDIWRRERPVGEVIADPATSPAVRKKLQFVLDVRRFAGAELDLPVDSNYERYADLDRPFVIWNVFATPEFSVTPVQWCFPIVGCVSYRGYFDKAGAERFAAGLAAEGKDVFVGGVPAYSTLGWFSDPVLNTFVNYADYWLARLIFHELAHRLVYVRDDTMFNESFAVTVEREGIKRWFRHHGTAQDRAAHEREQQIRDQFVQLVAAYGKRLKALYASGLAPSAMRARKAEVFEDMQRDYGKLRAQWGGFPGYDWWFRRKLNNAQIASVSIYTRLVPAFEALLQRNGGELPRFYAAVKELATLPENERTARLEALLPRS